ncbi:hypothetical protein RDWZM_003501 [Blomia tropicalis]|uniref:G-protein coupled receptors family 1 profile domain-containing protein n=1 Tax=Blomia tropicalis TaxID=40697 RepID=A0A9Q0MFI8_BLOTA|nr:hypothetical protein RDWZM_003501 [Blomia tropicalis]
MNVTEIIMDHPQFTLNGTDMIGQLMPIEMEIDQSTMVPNTISSNMNGTEREMEILDNYTFIVTVSILLGVMTVSTIIGNVFVIAAIILERNLRTSGNYLVLSLAVADLMVACLVMPFGAFSEIAQQWTLGTFLCDIWTSADVLCCTASILHLLAIALDRYWAVTYVDYIHKRTPQRIGVMIFTVWTVAAIVSIAPLFGWKDPDFITRVEQEKRCLISQDIGYQVFATISTFYGPLIFILVLYWKIYQVARKRIRHKPGKSVRPVSDANPKIMDLRKEKSALNGKRRLLIPAKVDKSKRNKSTHTIVENTTSGVMEENGNGTSIIDTEIAHSHLHPHHHSQSNGSTGDESLMNIDYTLIDANKLELKPQTCNNQNHNKNGSLKRMDNDDERCDMRQPKEQPTVNLLNIETIHQQYNNRSYSEPTFQSLDVSQLIINSNDYQQIEPNRLRPSSTSTDQPPIDSRCESYTTSSPTFPINRNENNEYIIVNDNYQTTSSPVSISSNHLPVSSQQKQSPPSPKQQQQQKKKQQQQQQSPKPILNQYQLSNNHHHHQSKKTIKESLESKRERKAAKILAIITGK